MNDKKIEVNMKIGIDKIGFRPVSTFWNYKI